MKIKSVFVASLLVSGIAFADTTTVDTTYVLGVLPLSLEENQTEVLIGIPWIEAGSTTAGGVAVTNLIKTAGLAVEDKLLWYNNGYQAWVIACDDNPVTESSVLYWKAANVTSKMGTAITAATETVLQRGNAVLLQRSGTASTTIYVVGQYEASATTAMSLGKGTSAAPVRTLIAPPRTAATDLNSATWTNVGEKDVIYIRANNSGLLKTFKYVKVDDDNWKWGYYSFTPSTWEETFNDEAIVPVGEGAWYISQSDNESETTIAWPAL